MDDLKQDTLDTKRVPAEALSAAGLAAPTGSASPLDDPAYQSFVEEMAKLCRCTPLSERPCDGLLAGGVCDDLHLDENDGCCDGARSDYFCGE